MAQAGRQPSKDDLARRRLVPLEQGERPLAVTIAAAVCFAIALANLALLVTGAEVSDSKPNAVGALSFAAIMVAAAYGLWTVRYWAVLGFQALLAIVMLLTSLSLFLANSVWLALGEVAAIGLSGTLFWFMVRSLARIQMPERGPK